MSRECLFKVGWDSYVLGAGLAYPEFCECEKCRDGREGFGEVRPDFDALAASDELCNLRTLPSVPPSGKMRLPRLALHMQRVKIG